MSTTQTQNPPTFENIDTSALYKTADVLRQLKFLEAQDSYLNSLMVRDVIDYLNLTDEENTAIAGLLRTFVQTRRDEAIAYLQQRTIK